LLVDLFQSSEISFSLRVGENVAASGKEVMISTERHEFAHYSVSIECRKLHLLWGSDKAEDVHLE